MEYNIYRMIGGDYSESKGFQLPIKGQFIEKIVEENNKNLSKGFKRICYIKGSDSIFVEDQKGDLQPMSVWFKFGDLRVDKTDHVLNEIAQKHKWFGVRYVLWSKEKETEQKLTIKRAKAAAIKLIDDSDTDKIKAIALAVKGPQAINWTDSTCELELREFAEASPKELQSIMHTKHYQSQLMAGLAFVKGLVKENSNKTAVVWSDSDGVILKLAKGENGIAELGRYLSQATDETKLVLQAIGERLDAIATDTVKQPKSALEIENENLKKQLAEFQKKSGSTVKGLSDLQQAQSEYKTVLKKDVPARYKNDLEWIQSKIKEAKPS